VSFTIKRNDTAPAYTATLTDEDDEVVDLTDATVTFTMTLVGATTPKVSAEADVVSAEDGTVSYSWGETDTDTAGLYRAEFEVTFEDLSVRTFPARDYFYVNIVADLA